MNLPAKIAIGVYAVTLASSAAYCAYWLQHVIRHGPHKRPPLEARITAWRHARRIDREWRKASLDGRETHG